MKSSLAVGTLLLALTGVTPTWAQQGGMGGGFGGGGAQQGGFGAGGQQFGGGLGGGNGMNRGPFTNSGTNTANSMSGRVGNGQSYDTSADAIEQRLHQYLNGAEVKNILTPGEYSEWPLTLKAGQVVISEARSDAFDPAIEIVDAKGKILGSNDDRYPGDQRPLLLWRCPSGGDYQLRVRCFHDKSGGQFNLRLSIYDSVDAGPAPAVDQHTGNSQEFLVRVHLKAGEVRQIVFGMPAGDYTSAWIHDGTISPTGLPDVALAQPIANQIPNAIMAPVEGDYYAVATGTPNRKIQVTSQQVAPSALATVNGACTSAAPTNHPAIWSLSVKAGDLVEASLANLPMTTSVTITEQPDVSKYDLDKPEHNPFVPGGVLAPGTPALTEMPARFRDLQVAVFLAKRDAKLWIATSGAGDTNKQFTLTVKPAQKAFTDGSPVQSKLTIGSTDYWAFDAKVGDVMTFDSHASNFAQKVQVFDPNLTPTWNSELGLNQTETNWNMIAQRPGRYLVMVSCMGDGGGGDYSLERKVYHAKTFGKGEPAVGSFSNGQVQVWSFTATPDDPLYVHWSSSVWNYQISMRTEDGSDGSLPLTAVDAANQYGILKVAKPTKFLIVLVPGDSKAKYAIELSDLPGYRSTVASTQQKEVVGSR